MCQKLRTHFYATLVDLTKAFDTMDREGLWKIMHKFDCPGRFIRIARQFHDGMMARVTDNGASSKAFLVSNGVKQGYVLAPTIFILMFSAVLTDSYRDERPVLRSAYRTDGHLNSGRMPAGKRLSTTTVHGLLLADNCVLNAATEVNTQRSMDLLATGCANVGLTIDTNKTVVIHQPSHNTRHCTPPRITVDGQQLKTVGNFVYLGSKLSNSTRIDDEVAHRILKDS
ncbi:hypothetical protein SprV_0401540100 [Sparganum proliferum]